MFRGSDAWAWQVRLGLGGFMALAFAGCMLTR
jgi:hypothetical protein